MFYSVKYRKPGQWFFRKLRNVKGDGLLENGRARWFIMADDSRVEIPAEAEFHFCPGRFKAIVQNAEKQSGQQIPVQKTPIN